MCKDGKEVVAFLLRFRMAAAMKGIRACLHPVIARRPEGPTWQSIAPFYEHERYGLPRRFAPRNDGGGMVAFF
jgi:hypothetical protein